MTFQPNPLMYLTVAAPCSANWDEMTGNEQVRFCSLCQLNVYNLSGMNRSEAEDLLISKEGKLCVRYYQREDGTILTQDCPVGLQAIHRRKISKRFKTGIAAAITLITLAGCFTVVANAAGQAPASIHGQFITGSPPDLRHTMGEIAAPPTTPPQVLGGVKPTKPSKAEPTHPVPLMGKPMMPPQSVKSCPLPQTKEKKGIFKRKCKLKKQS